jgi:hypothetical protein
MLLLLWWLRLQRGQLVLGLLLMLRLIAGWQLWQLLVLLRPLL